MRYLADEIRHRLRDKSFRPFTICLKDGRRVPVLDADFALVAPGSRSISVFMANDEHHLVDVSSLSGIEPWAFGISPDACGDCNEPPYNPVIRAMLTARPFVPFTIQLTGGSRHSVALPELAAFTPSGWCLNICDKNGLRSILALEHVVSVDVTNAPPEPTAIR